MEGLPVVYKYIGRKNKGKEEPRRRTWGASNVIIQWGV